MSALSLVALGVQHTRRRYVPSVYWTVVVLVSVVGTLISDNLVDNLGISLRTTSIAFACALAVVFVAWWLSEHTLSVHSIRTTKGELFYRAVTCFHRRTTTAASVWGLRPPVLPFSFYRGACNIRVSATSRSSR